MILTPENYHSEEAKRTWLSASAVKQAMRCEYEWNAYRTGAAHEDESKEAFKLGHYFETMVSGTDAEIERFKIDNPEIFSSKGPTKGQLKSTYKDVDKCVEAVKNQPFLMNIINSCKKQVILTGNICGVPFRMMCDLIRFGDGIYDLKCMDSFKRIWSLSAESYVEWYEYWNYPAQMYIYKEIAEQNGISVPCVGLIAASKSNADIQAIQFGRDVLLQARSDVEYTVGRMKDIMNGDEPIRCQHCDVCIGSRKIESFVEV